MNFNFYAYANKQFCNTGTILKDSIPSAKVQINLQFARIYPYLTPKFRLFDQTNHHIHHSPTPHNTRKKAIWNQQIKCIAEPT